MRPWVVSILLTASLAGNAWLILSHQSAPATRAGPGTGAVGTTGESDLNTRGPVLTPRRASSSDLQVRRLRAELDEVRQKVATLAPEVAAVAFETSITGQIAALAELEGESRERAIEMLARVIRDMPPSQHDTLATQILYLVELDTQPAASSIVMDLLQNGGLDFSLSPPVQNEVLSRLTGTAVGQTQKLALAWLLRGSLSEGPVRHALNTVATRALREAKDAQEALPPLFLALSPGLGIEHETRDAIMNIVVQTVDDAARRRILRAIAGCPGSETGEGILYDSWRSTSDPVIRSALIDAYATSLVRPSTSAEVLAVSRSRFLDVYAACQDDALRRRLLFAASSRLGLMRHPRPDLVDFLHRIAKAEPLASRQEQLADAVGLLEDGDMDAAVRVLQTMD